MLLILSVVGASKLPAGQLCCFDPAKIEFRQNMRALIIPDFLCPEVLELVLKDVAHSAQYKGGSLWEDRGNAFPGKRFESVGEHRLEGPYMQYQESIVEDPRVAAFKDGTLFKQCLDQVSLRGLWPEALTPHLPETEDCCARCPNIFAPSCVAAQSVRTSYMSRAAHSSIIHHDFDPEDQNIFVMNLGLSDRHPMHTPPPESPS